MFFLYVVGVPAVAAFVGFFAVTGGTAVAVAVYLSVAHLSIAQLSVARLSFVCL